MPLTVQPTVNACPPSAWEPFEVVWVTLWEFMVWEIETVGAGIHETLVGPTHVPVDEQDQVSEPEYPDAVLYAVID